MRERILPMIGRDSRHRTAERLDVSVAQLVDLDRLRCVDGRIIAYGTDHNVVAGWGTPDGRHWSRIDRHDLAHRCLRVWDAPSLAGDGPAGTVAISRLRVDTPAGLGSGRRSRTDSIPSGVVQQEEASAIPAWRELFAGGLARTTLGLLLMEGLVAVQVLVTVAVLPAVVSDLGGVRMFGAALSSSQVATVIVLPFTPRLVTRWGLRGAFFVSLGAFVTGSLVVISAPTAWVFVAGLFVQGAGSGAQYALLLTVFTRRYPLRLRPRMYGALAVAWALPGLVGPAYGGFVASTLGWRWAFALILPLVIPAVWMLHPSVTDGEDREEPSSEMSSATAPVLIVFAVSMLALLAALTASGRWGAVVVIPFAVAAVAMLTRILPKGTFTSRRGLPAVVASGFLANAAFYSVDGFLPVYLTRVAGLTLTVAALVVTCGTLAWTIGTWAQARLANSLRIARIATLGEVLMLLGVGGVIAGVSSSSAFVVYVAWGVAALGMGMTYPAIGVLATEVASSGDEVTTLAQYQLGDVLGSAFGPALVGSAVTTAASRGLHLQDGLLTGFGATCVLVLAALFASTRLPATSSVRAGPHASPMGVRSG